MKNIILTILLMTPALSFAHGDHPPRVATCTKECTKADIEASIPKSLEILAKAGRIEASWTSAKIEKVEQKQFKKGPEWMATLLDEKPKDKTKQRLYVFITTKGFLNGVNYTGE